MGTKDRLNQNYIKAVDAYVNEFEKVYEVESEFWVGDEVGGVLSVADLMLDFSDIKYCVDNSIPYEWLYNWNSYCVEFSKAYYNLDSYSKLRRDYEKKLGKNFTETGFEKHLLYLRLKSNKS